SSARRSTPTSSSVCSPASTSRRCSRRSRKRRRRLRPSRSAARSRGRARSRSRARRCSPRSPKGRSSGKNSAVTPRPPLDKRFPRPSVMGVINVTPDSFSDGGVHLRLEAACAEAFAMLDAGAAIVDVGGESTRPGANPVPLDEELRRVEPVLVALAGQPVSVDTSKAEVARRALALGVELVNDVTAFRADPELAGVVAAAGAYVCLMHMLGEPRTMQAAPAYDDVVSDVKAFLEERLGFAVGAGIAEERVCLDPGIGFGKTVEHNFELVRRL